MAKVTIANSGLENTLNQSVVTLCCPFPCRNYGRSVWRSPFVTRCHAVNSLATTSREAKKRCCSTTCVCSVLLLLFMSLLIRWLCAVCGLRCCVVALFGLSLTVIFVRLDCSTETVYCLRAVAVLTSRSFCSTSAAAVPVDRTHIRTANRPESRQVHAQQAARRYVRVCVMLLRFP